MLGALHKFAGLKVSPEAFVEALEELQPRLYSISSSPKHAPGRLSLTVDCVRYRLGQRQRMGVASTFLAERITPGESLPVYVQEAHGFGLPADPATPVIMVGPGTGIAPFRAFLQERAAIGAPGRNWLFFGHQRMKSDFFYADELNAMKERGQLDRLTLAWSRDGARRSTCRTGCARRGPNWAWLQDGAHFYVCGDAKRMAKDVERALVDIAAQHGGLSTTRRSVTWPRSGRRAAIRRTSTDGRPGQHRRRHALPHHLPLLRRGLWRAGDAGWRGRGDDRRRSRASR